MSGGITITNLKIKFLAPDSPTQWEVAYACGFHPSVMSRYVLGQEAISTKHLKALCDYFDCDQTEILGSRTLKLEGK